MVYHANYTSKIFQRIALPQLCYEAIEFKKIKFRCAENGIKNRMVFELSCSLYNEVIRANVTTIFPTDSGWR